MSIQKRFKKPPTTITAVTPFTGPRLLRIKSAAAYLSLGVGTLRKMVRDRTILHSRGNKILIDRLDLDRFIEHRKVGAEVAA